MDTLKIRQFLGSYVPAEYEKEGIHMSDAINLQEAILKEVRRDKVPVTLFLMNGFQLRGHYGL